jgi:hypothetical protein
MCAWSYSPITMWKLDNFQMVIVCNWQYKVWGIVACLYHQQLDVLIWYFDHLKKSPCVGMELFTHNMCILVNLHMVFVSNWWNYSPITMWKLVNFHVVFGCNWWLKNHMDWCYLNNRNIILLVHIYMVSSI